MQTEIMTEYIFYHAGVIVFYSFFQQNNSILLLHPISAFNTLMTVVKFTKIVIKKATAYEKTFFTGCERTKSNLS